MNNVTRNRIIAGVATAAMVATGGLFIHRHNTPNKCEAIFLDVIELTELSTEYVNESDNLIQLGGALQPILSDINRNNLELKRNDCRGKIRDQYIETYDEVYDEYRETVKTRYPFMTNWL